VGTGEGAAGNAGQAVRRSTFWGTACTIRVTSGQKSVTWLRVLHVCPWRSRCCSDAEGAAGAAAELPAAVVRHLCKAQAGDGVVAASEGARSWGWGGSVTLALGCVTGIDQVTHVAQLKLVQAAAGAALAMLWQLEGILVPRNLNEWRDAGRVAGPRPQHSVSFLPVGCKERVIAVIAGCVPGVSWTPRTGPGLDVCARWQGEGEVNPHCLLNVPE
jgi:hypothetical protein